MKSSSRSGTAAFLPAGFSLLVEADGLVVSNDGDLVIEAGLSGAGPIKRISSQNGSVRVSLPDIQVDSILAENGHVELQGNAQVQHLRGQVVRHGGGTLRARVVHGGSEVSLEGNSVDVEFVIAPRVAFAASTDGRARAVETRSDLGPTKVRGRYSLTEYLDDVPSARAALDSLGISASDPFASFGAHGRAPAAPAARQPASDAEDEEAEPAPAPVAASEPGTTPAEGSLAPAADPPGPPVTPEGPAVDQQVRESLRRIVDIYGRDELPPPVVFLERLVGEERYDYIKLQLKSIWRDLLKYHEKKGLRIPNTVTQQFQTVQALVGRMP